MAEIDTAQEWRRLQELYVDMSEEELEAVAADGYELTDIAKQALNAEIARRHLNVIVRLQPPDQEPELEGDPEFDPANLDLTWGFDVENREQAEWAKKTLNDAGVPCYFGPDLQEDVQQVEFHQDRFVHVGVLKNDLNRLPQLLRQFGERFPSEPDPGPVDLARCPKCNSPDIMLLAPDSELSEAEPDQENDDGDERPDPDLAIAPAAASTRWQWHCDACGYEWRNDVTEPES